MANHKQMLIAIDDFRSAQPLLEYAADLAHGRDDYQIHLFHALYQIHLFHALEPLPPQLLESPGAEEPAREERIEEKQISQQERWVDRSLKRLEPLLESSKSQLASAQVPRDRIKTHVFPLNHREDLVAEIIKAAHDNDCGTILVGYKSYPWIREQFHTHISEQLLTAADDCAVCVVRRGD